MGYYIHQREAVFHVLPVNEDALKAAVLAIPFLGSWCDVSDPTDSLERVFLNWRWELERTDGEITGIQFYGEKYGDDDDFMEAIAPFVEVGSYIEMQGEEGERWRWLFNGTKRGVEKIFAQVRWD